MMKRESSERSIQMVIDPLEGLPRPQAHARNEPPTSSSATNTPAAAGASASYLQRGGPSSLSSSSFGGGTGTAPPLIDATKIVPYSLVGSGTATATDPSKQRQRSFTRIEGMEALDKPIGGGGGGVFGGVGGEESSISHMSDAEKRMKEEELSFYSASDNDHGDDNIWGLLSGVGGNIYEWSVLLFF